MYVFSFRNSYREQNLEQFETMTSSFSGHESLAESNISEFDSSFLATLQRAKSTAVRLCATIRRGFHRRRVAAEEDSERVNRAWTAAKDALAARSNFA